MPCKVDWALLQDHGRPALRVREPEQYILVRHQDGHVGRTWEGRR